MRLFQSLLDLGYLTTEDLKTIKEEFEGADDNSEAAADATGHDELRDKVQDFADKWRIKREEMTENVVKLQGIIKQIVDIYNTQGFMTEVLAASIRNPLHIVRCAEAGADVCTCPLSSITGLLKHPLTDLGLAQFLKDAQSLG